MHIARLPTVRVSVVTTRCQSHGECIPTHSPFVYLLLGFIYPVDTPTAWITHPLGIPIVPSILTPHKFTYFPNTYPPRYLPPEGTWYQRHLTPRRDLAPEIPTPRRGLVPEIPTPRRNLVPEIPTP